MGKGLHHRLSRWLRLAVTWAVAFHGSLTPWATGPLFAQTTDTIQLGLTPVSNALPAPITDLLAAANPVIQGQISLTWTSPQGNDGGIPINNQTVAAYDVRYATFSVASLAGDTTSWWNGAAPSDTGLKPPNYFPKPPGQLEAFSFSNLTPGVTYYFGIKSNGINGSTSTIDTESASPNQQAWAVATQLVTGAAPLRPNGLFASAFGGQFTLTWHPVTLDTNRQPVSIDHYVVTRYDTIGWIATVSTVLPANTNSYTDTVGGLTYYYRIVAWSVGGAASASSDYVDSSSDLNRYAIASDDIDTRVVMPMSLAKELNKGFNNYDTDLELIFTRRQQDEIDMTLRSYHIGAYHTVTGEEFPLFAFTDDGIQVQMGLGSILSSGHLSFGQKQALQKISSSDAATLAQIIRIYWFNGTSYIRVGDPVLTFNQALSVTVKNLGNYQVRATEVGSSFALIRGSPYPRIITPNDPSQNNRVFWFFDNPAGDVVSGTIFDIRGAKVRDLAMNSQSPTTNSIVWDGRDNQGAVVHSGVYLYKITSGKEKVTGTVVVAR